jgi:hypothetical protein
MALIAEDTRSRLSPTALSASPTMLKWPLLPVALMWTWTSTSRASMPSNATV